MNHLTASSGMPSSVQQRRCTSIDLQAVIRDWLSSLSERTRAAYRQDLADFSAFIGAADELAAALALVQDGQASANVTALRYRTHLAERKLAPATINRRLAALRSAVGILRVAGAVTWPLEVKPMKLLKYKDTRGPGVAGVRSLIRATWGQSEKALRDRALIHLLFDMGLRRGEVVSLDVQHLDLVDRRLQVRGKGHGSEREALTIPAPAADALRAYVAARGTPASGPLFTNQDRAKKGDGRLTGEGVRRILGAIAERAGVSNVRPHGLRHAAITAALDAGRDVREVLRFSRHKDPRTLMHYDDSRRDHAGEVASVVAALIS
jgi:integrase/recombinase XerC